MENTSDKEIILSNSKTDDENDDTSSEKSEILVSASALLKNSMTQFRTLKNDHSQVQSEGHVGNGKEVHIDLTKDVTSTRQETKLTVKAASDGSNFNRDETIKTQQVNTTIGDLCGLTDDCCMVTSTRCQDCHASTAVCVCEVSSQRPGISLRAESNDAKTVPTNEISADEKCK